MKQVLTENGSSKRFIVTSAPNSKYVIVDIARVTADGKTESVAAIRLDKSEYKSHTKAL